MATLSTQATTQFPNFPGGGEHGEPQVPEAGLGSAKGGGIESICMDSAHKEQLPRDRAPAGPELHRGGGGGPTN